MPGEDIAESLGRNGIQPSARRVAMARYVLRANSHPTAGRLWMKVRENFPYVPRATVYNALSLFLRKGWLRQHLVDEAGAVFDPNIERHHHFADEETGRIHDIEWDQLNVTGLDSLSDLEITEYMVLVRGRRRDRSGDRERRTGANRQRQRKEEES